MLPIWYEERAAEWLRKSEKRRMRGISREQVADVLGAGTSSGVKKTLLFQGIL